MVWWCDRVTRASNFNVSPTSGDEKGKKLSKGVGVGRGSSSIKMYK